MSPPHMSGAIGWAKPARSSDPDKIATLDAASAGDTAAAVPLARIPAVQGDAISNAFTGKANKVIQLRDVHGDLTIN